MGSLPAVGWVQELPAVTGKRDKMAGPDTPTGLLQLVTPIDELIIADAVITAPRRTAFTAEAPC